LRRARRGGLHPPVRIADQRAQADRRRRGAAPQGGRELTPKLWGGRFEAEPSELLRRLNDSFAFDRELFAEDVEGSIAWARALGEAGVLTAAEAQTIVAGLQRVPAPVSGDYEDVHTYVESTLYEEIGDLAGKLHTGRSRNDQVATDLRLWLKKAAAEAID